MTQNCSYVINSTYSSLMQISGIHSMDLGTVSMFIPQKSEGFQVRNSFVHRWENKKLCVIKHVVTQVDECES